MSYYHYKLFQVGARFSVRTGLKKQFLISRFLVKIAISFETKDSYHSKYFEKCVDLK